MIRIRDSVRIPGRVSLTYWFLALNVLGFWVSHYQMDPSEVIVHGGVIPAEWFSWASPSVTFAGRAPTVVTIVWAMFIHGSWMHLIVNSLFLYWFAPNVEARCGLLRFAVFYLACGGAGFLLQVVVDHDSTAPIIGASGAISGLLGAYWVWFDDHFMRITLGTPRSRVREVIIPIKAIIIIWLLLQISSSLVDDAHQTNQVAYFTHFGGFLCGYFLARTTKRGPRRSFKVFEGGKRDAPFTD